MTLEVLERGTGRPPVDRLVELRQLLAHGDLPVAKYSLDVLESADEPVRRLEANNRPGLGRKLGKEPETTSPSRSAGEVTPKPAPNSTAIDPASAGRAQPFTVPS